MTKPRTKVRNTDRSGRMEGQILVNEQAREGEQESIKEAGRRPRGLRGMGRIYQRRGPRGMWWVQYYDREGRLHRESSRSRVRRDAVALLQRRLGERASGQ